MLIGELAQQSGVSARMLRHFDRIGLLSATGRTAGGYREYSPADAQRLFHIETLRALGLSLREVKAALQSPDFSPRGVVDEVITRTRERIAVQQRLLRRLEHVTDTVDDDAAWTDVLDLVALLRALESTAESPASGRQQAVLTQSPTTPSPVDALVDSLVAEHDRNTIGSLQWAIIQAGPAAIGQLRKHLQHDDPEVRRRIVDTLGTLDPTAVSEALTDPHPDVRGRAALIVGAAGAPAALPHLVDMIVTGDRDVQAAEKLGRLDPSTAVTTLRKHLDQNAEVRGRITQALAEIPGPQANSLLNELTDDPDRTVAGTARAVLSLRNPAENTT